MTVSGCTLSGNTAFGFGGINNGFIGLGGGGIFNMGTITASGCTLSNNHAQGDGGALYVWGGTVTLTNDVVENNLARFGGHYSGKGGGIFTYVTVYLDPFTLAHTVNNTDVSGTNSSTANIDGPYILL